MIEGVVVTPLRQIHDERGKVMHMLRRDSPVFQEFGEIYFSCVDPGVVKGWHLHYKMTLNYAVILGKIKLVLFDDRPDSTTRGQTQELYLSPENYCLVTVPPRIWSGFKGLGNEASIVANCSTLPHDPGEIERRPLTDSANAYDWNVGHG